MTAERNRRADEIAEARRCAIFIAAWGIAIAAVVVAARILK